jgi:hypothetical protein
MIQTAVSKILFWIRHCTWPRAAYARRTRLGPGQHAPPPPPPQEQRAIWDGRWQRWEWRPRVRHALLLLDRLKIRPKCVRWWPIKRYVLRWINDSVSGGNSPFCCVIMVDFFRRSIFLEELIYISYIQSHWHSILPWKMSTSAPTNSSHLHMQLCFHLRYSH